MRFRTPIEYSTVSAIRGPLLVIEGINGVGWNEVVEVRLASGEVRHGVVLDVSRELATVEVYEGTSGLALDGLSVDRKSVV